MKTTLKNVTEALRKRNYEFTTFATGAAGKILLLPKFGRVLGFWSDPEQQSHFWINEDFLKSESEHWQNPGGHRMWIAPEREFFIKDLDNVWDTYLAPEAFDPGNYKHRTEANVIILENQGSARAFASNIEVSFKLTRKIQALSCEAIKKFIPTDQITAAGYEEQTTLETCNSTALKVGLWSLVQINPGGVASVLAKNKPEYTTFFGHPDKALSISGDIISTRFSPQGEWLFKIGLKASTVENKIIYLQKYTDGTASAIIKVIELGHDRDYADTPWDQPNDLGYAIQLFYGSNYGFGELESHSPVHLDPTGRPSCDTKTEVYAIKGSQKQIRDIIESLLAKRG